MTFFALLDYKNKSANHDNYLTLRVESDKGVETIPDMDINITKLNKNGNTRNNHFFSNGYAGNTFKITVLIKETDIWNNKKVTTQLHDWFKDMTPLHVVTEAIDVDDGEYIITKNPTRQQNTKGFTVWDLEFTSYTPLSLYKYKNDNSSVLNALNKKRSSSIKTNNSKLKACNYKILVYSKKKKVVTCVKYLQKVLKTQKVYSGKIDGWFGNETKNAVKKFQKNYNKKNVKTKTINGSGSGIVKVTAGTLITNTNNNENINLPNGIVLGGKTGKGSTVVKVSGINKTLPTNGKVDKATFQALCK